MQDHVDTILEQWEKERPDLDVSPMGTIGRISRAATYISQELKDNFRQHDLTPADFDVMATLRRAGEPYGLTPTDLFSTLMITSGTMTNRIDRLEKAGFVTRQPNPADRRGVIVVLTEKGKNLIDVAVETHVQRERELLSALTPDEVKALSGLLRKLLHSLESQTVF